MADGALDTVLSWLRGKPAIPTVENAPPLASYPSQADAEYARKYGFGDNSINEDYLNNNKAKVLGANIPSGIVSASTKPQKRSDAQTTFVPFSGSGQTLEALTGAVDDPKTSTVLNLNDPKNNTLQDDLRNLHMRAALAANRNPIAAVGFDPSRVVLDSLLKGSSTFGGAYWADPDGIYSKVDPKDSVVHESIHRGIEKLRNQYPDKAPKLLSNLPKEEYVVRWLMNTLGGNPEGGPTEEIGEKQKQTAIDLFDAPDKWASNAQRQETLKALQELAIDHMKGRGKRAGPQ